MSGNLNHIIDDNMLCVVRSGSTRNVNVSDISIYKVEDIITEIWTNKDKYCGGCTSKKELNLICKGTVISRKLKAVVSLQKQKE